MGNKRILFVLYQRFDQIPDGGDLCNKRNLEMVKKICGEDNVDVYYLRHKIDKSIKEAVEFMLYMPLGYYRGITPRKVRDICRKANDYDCVFLSSSLFGIIAKKLKTNGFKGKIVTQFHNVESKYYSCIIPHYVPFRKNIIKCIFNNERNACYYSSVRLALNNRDKETLDTFSSKQIDFVLPITLADKAGTIIDKTLTSEMPLVTFIGSNFPPNAEGILWFVKNVLPFVKIHFRIVGKNMDELKKGNDSLSNIEVYSNVPDLGDYFKETDVIVASIFSGSGMKVKTCEALMFGKNILGSTEAFEGYELDFDKAGRKADSAQEYIDYLNGISEKPIPRFNEYSRNVYVTKYSNEVAKEIFKKILM